MESVQTRQLNYVAPPTAGGIVALAASTIAVIVDLTSMAGWPGNQVNGVDQGASGKDQNPIDHYLTLEADGNDIYVAFGPTVASLSGIANTTTTTTVTSNQLTATNTANGVVKIPNGTLLRVRLPAGSNPATTPWGANSQCRYLCFLTASTTGTLRMWQSSP